MSRQRKTIQEYVRENPLPWAIQVVGILVIVLNLWLASKLAPMAERISGLDIKVEALEEQYKDFSQWLVRVETKLDSALVRGGLNPSVANKENK